MAAVRRSLVCAVSLAVALLAMGSHAAEPKQPKQIASVEGITEYQLDNGFKVLLFPDPSQPKVTVNLTVRPVVRARLPEAPARVVELGCGPLGGLVPGLRAAGYDAVGVDPAAPDGDEYR